MAAYRYNGHVGDPNGTDNGMSLEEIDEGIFFHRPPSKFMQNVVKTANSKQNIIMSHAQNEREMNDKHLWLNKHFPEITERLITLESVPKYKTILGYCKNNNISLSDIIFVDDVLKILRQAEKHGIPSFHISSFLDWNYDN